MKIAVLSDIHANFVALMAAVEHLEHWKPDFVVINGDIINRGPRPLECLEYILDKVYSENWLLIRGNHEDYVISQELPDAPKKGPSTELHRASNWTYHKIRDISPLESIPFQQSIFDPAGHELRFIHGSMRGLRDGIYPETTQDTIKEKLGLNQNNYSKQPPILFCVGHTHRAFIREISAVKIVNAGSVGLPFDRDQRLAYAQLSFKNGIWSAKVIRLEYDLENAEKDIFKSGYYDEAGPLIQLVLMELREAASQLYNWSVSYQELVLSGDITMEESVKQYIQSLSNST